MTRHWLVLLLIAAFAAPLFAEPPKTTLPPKARIYTPDDMPKPEEDEDPELIGAERAGTLPGTLPEVLFEYVLSVGTTFQRISVFDNGIASVHVVGVGDSDIRRRVLLPPEKIDDLQKIGDFDPAILDPFTSEADDYALFRIFRKGKVVERRVGAVSILPQEVELFRRALGDVLQAIADDIRVANPLRGYVAKKGDKLIGHDRRLYEVTAILNQGTIVEVTSTVKPMRFYVSAEMLHQLFSGLAGASTR